MISNSTTEKAARGMRLSIEETALLLEKATLCEAGLLADRARLKKADPGRVTYIRDRNINYTNICTSGCRFCAFYKDPGDPNGYVITLDELGCKIREALELGAVQILLQGGLHPDLRLGFYLDMLGFIRSSFDIHVHGFSPPEIMHIARLEGMTVKEVLSEMIREGLGSIPGGGAEILDDFVRGSASPGKCTKTQWLDVMKTAHKLGLKTTATMMFGHGETTKERIAHLLAIRKLQDETGGFTAFIPWTFQPDNTKMAHMKPLGSHEYLKMIATCRLALDNIENIQVSWVTQGARVAQAALFFGANDFGSTMIEENVVAAAGVSFRMSADEIERMIRTAGFVPAERNQAYELIGKDG